MQKKSNTQEIVSVWMRACFEKLMAEERATCGSEKDPSQKVLTNNTQTAPNKREGVSHVAKSSSRMRQNT